MSETLLKWMRATDIQRNPVPGFNAHTGMQKKMVDEEIQEFYNGWTRAQEFQTPDGYAELLDGICDSIWCLIQLAHNMGLPFEEAWEQVRKSNMAKITADGRVRRREDGKILKPDGWIPPDILSLVKSRFPKAKVENDDGEK